MKSTSPFWTSKTFWVNLVALLSLISPSVRDWLASNPVEIGGALAAVNIIIKFVTHGQHELVDDTTPSEANGKGQSPSPTHETSVGVDARNASASAVRSISRSGKIGMLALLLCSLGLLSGLSSCGGNVTYDHESGTLTIVGKDGHVTTFNHAYPSPTVDSGLEPTQVRIGK